MSDDALFLMDASALTLPADALEDELPDSNPGKPGHHGKGYGYVSRNPKVLRALLALADVGHTGKEIAAAMGISRSEVSRTLREYEPVLDLAKRRIDGAQLQAVEGLIDAIPAAVKKGLHGPQVALLEAGGLIKTEDKGTHVHIQIGASAQDVQIGIALEANPTFRPSLSPPIDSESVAASD